MSRDRALSVRLDSKEFEALSREARALRLTDSAYVRLLLERGRDRMFLQHMANELKGLQSHDAHEAAFLQLSAVAETRALVRAVALRTVGAEGVRKEQEALVPGLEKWRARLRGPELAAQGGQA
jgi:hypothetical protein